VSDFEIRHPSPEEAAAIEAAYERGRTAALADIDGESQERWDAGPQGEEYAQAWCRGYACGCFDRGRSVPRVRTPRDAGRVMTGHVMNGPCPCGRDHAMLDGRVTS
jgi:hypothetical protein